jgi:hypothetical protein
VRRLDPLMPTGVANTFWLKGDYARALEETRSEQRRHDGADPVSLGKDAEAIESFAHDVQRFAGNGESQFAGVLRLGLLGRRDEARPTVLEMMACRPSSIPRGTFHAARDPGPPRRRGSRAAHAGPHDRRRLLRHAGAAHRPLARFAPHRASSGRCSTARPPTAARPSTPSSWPAASACSGVMAG